MFFRSKPKPEQFEVAIPQRREPKAVKPKASKLEKEAAKIAKQMGNKLATAEGSTFKPSHVGSRTLDEWRARRAAEKAGLIQPEPAAPVNQRFAIDDSQPAQVTQLPVDGKRKRRA